MPKYYDPTTDTLTDYDPRVQAQTSTSPVANQGSQESASGLTTSDPLKLMFAQLMQGNPKQVSNLKTIYEMMKPEENKITAEQKNRIAALKPAKIVIDKALKDTYEGTGPQNLPANLSLRYLGGLGVSTPTKYKKSRFSLLKQTVVRAFQGARMSDTDIEMAREYIPDITDTPDTIKVKLTVLKEVINNMENP